MLHREPDDDLNARQIDPACFDEVIDGFEPLNIALGIKPCFPQGPAWRDQPQPLVLPDGLLVQMEQMGDHADGINRMFSI